MSQIQKHITLGFSCQSSFTNYWTNSGFTRSPFDFNIVNKKFLLNALDPHRSPFDFKPEDFHQFKSFDSGTDGIAADGIFFWHDFKRDETFVNWRDEIQLLIHRYKRRWERFVDVCRQDDVKKIFLMANTQHNLSEFCGERFSENFGLDEEFINLLLDRLFKFGVTNFCLDLTVREISEYISILPIIKRGNGVLKARFCGPMTLPTNASIVSETAFDLLGYGDNFGDVEEICGVYSCGMTIERISKKSAVVSNSDGALGEVRPFPNGYIFCFANLVDNFLRGTFQNGQIVFENRQMWTRI